MSATTSSVRLQTRIALVGDYSAEVAAHRAIPQALTFARSALGAEFEWEWFQTRDITNAARDLALFSAVWVVPASPYESMDGALDAIRFARETRRPFLGTCGGFQHALIEIARNLLGISADHAESHPNGTDLVVTRLTCSLVEATNTLRLAPGSLIQAAYGRDTATEGYRCNFGPNPGYRERFENAGLRFTAFDDAGNPRAAELPRAVHPFFVGTLFQPERAALRGELSPLVRAFAEAAMEFSP
jgi:CTP synthase (UTP-ammonia lyase)